MAQETAEWLARFHAGDRPTLEACYRDHFSCVEQGMAPLVRGAERETLIQSLFRRLFEDANLRREFSGGSVEPWLAGLARHQAADHLQSTHRSPPPEAPQPASPQAVADILESDPEARRRVDRFRAEVLPKLWEPVFDARFVQRLDPQQAAQQLGLGRSTLAYRELRILALLRTFILHGDG